MFTIILKNKENDEIERVSLADNELYLQQEDEVEFPYLSELSGSSYDVFDHSDMNDLIAELKKIRSTLLDENHKMHVDKIIDLALCCMKTTEFRIYFTPFGGAPIKG
jgi:hypothetical protein